MNTVPKFEELLLAEGAQYLTSAETVARIELKEMGDIEFPSGRVMLADPDLASLGDWPALEGAVPAGKHPLYITQSAHEYFTSVTAVWVRFSNEPVVRWVPAEFGDRENFNFVQPETTNMIFLGDAESVPPLFSYDSLDRLDEVFDVDPDEYWDARFHPDAEDTAFVSSTGDFNGFFIPYWGMDADNKPAYLVIDLDELKTPVFEKFILDFPIKRGPIEHEIIGRAGGTLVRTKLPIWGPTRLQAEEAVPEVRLLRNGKSEKVGFKLKGLTIQFEIDDEPGDKLELSYVVSFVPAQPIDANDDDDDGLW